MEAHGTRGITGKRLLAGFRFGLKLNAYTHIPLQFLMAGLALPKLAGTLMVFSSCRGRRGSLSDLPKTTTIEIIDRLRDLFAGVHHEGTVADNGLVQGSAIEQQ